MNKVQRAKINDAIELLESAKTILSELAEEESEKYDNLPESLQYSERGEMFQQNTDDLEEACDDIDMVVENLQDIVNA